MAIAAAFIALAALVGGFTIADRSSTSVGKRSALSTACFAATVLLSLVTFVVIDMGCSTRFIWPASAVLTALAWFGLKRRATSRADEAVKPLDVDAAPRWTWIVLAVAASALTYVHWQWSSIRPFGEWDAMAIWNVRARTLARIDGDAAAIFRRFIIGHPDYPLHLPATIAALWKLTGEEAAIVPRLFAYFVTLATGLQVLTAIERLGGRRFAPLGAAVVLATPHVILVGQAQIADLLLAGLYVHVASTFAATLDARRTMGSPLLLGFLLASLAWTKNEGIVLALVALLLWLAFARRDALRLGLAKILAGAAPVTLALLRFKLSWAPTNDLVRDTDFARHTENGFWSKLGDLARWTNVRRGLWNELGPKGRERWTYVWPASIALVVAAAPTLRRPAFRFLFLLLALQAALWLLVYVVTPREQTWHIDTSLNRLLLQLYPTLIATLVAAGHSICRSRNADASQRDFAV